MEADGLITRCPGSGRSKVEVRLTDAGRDVFDQSLRTRPTRGSSPYSRRQSANPWRRVSGSSGARRFKTSECPNGRSSSRWVPTAQRTRDPHDVSIERPVSSVAVETREDHAAAVQRTVRTDKLLRVRSAFRLHAPRDAVIRSCPLLNAPRTSLLTAQIERPVGTGVREARPTLIVDLRHVPRISPVAIMSRLVQPLPFQ